MTQHTMTNLVPKDADMNNGLLHYRIEARKDDEWLLVSTFYLQPWDQLYFDYGSLVGWDEIRTTIEFVSTAPKRTLRTYIRKHLRWRTR